MRLHPDATVTWTDPLGRQHLTHPIDRLEHLMLPAPADPINDADPTPNANHEDCQPDSLGGVAVDVVREHARAIECRRAGIGVHRLRWRELNVAHRAPDPDAELHRILRPIKASLNDARQRAWREQRTADDPPPF